MAGSSVGSSVIGVIDGKFESGYIVTVTMGSEKLKGVLYHAPQNPSLPASHNNNIASLGVHRRQNKRKSAVKRRDLAFPNPKRIGYSFFFAEQHARLKLLHQGKETEIARVIDDLWNELKESEKLVYEEKGTKDEERYIAEMRDYEEELKMGEVITDAVPLQQWPPKPDTYMMDVDTEMNEAEAKEGGYGGSEYEDYNVASGRGFDNES